MTNAELKQILEYDPDTGIFKWIDKRFGIREDMIAGSANDRGYINISINYKRFLAHRLAWFYFYDYWPKSQIDHINGIRGDNRIINLREATARDNNLNRGSHRNGKLTGAHYNKKDKRWASTIKIKGIRTWLGNYKTEQEAHLAYIKAHDKIKQEDK